MGKSDGHLFPWYKSILDIHQVGNGKTALLGFRDSPPFIQGDCYDKELNNWDINSEWELPELYDVIISTRCPYFANDPIDFMRRVHASLNPGGRILIDWGLGDHWRFQNYKVGWVKDNEHEHAYGEDNKLWSALWHNRYLMDPEVRRFVHWIKDKGYDGDLTDTICKEVPNVLAEYHVNEYFNYQVYFKALWKEAPALYIAICGVMI